MDAAYRFSKFLVNTTFDDLPKEAVEVVKKDILDCLGNTLGGSSDTAIEAVSGLVRQWKGKRESSVVAFGMKTLSFNAALLNAAMAFVLDQDDTHERARLHAGVATVPTAFAIAESKGGASGKELIAALCAAIEVACRLGIASERRTSGHIMGGWDYACLHGTFSSAAVAGKLLNLKEEQMHHALGISYHQAAGNTLSAIDGADTKKLGPGLAARAGIFSALLAERGITGAKAIFDESQFGLCRLYHAGVDSGRLLSGLGERFEMCDMGFKPYPSCRLGHRHVDAVLKLVKEHDVKPEEIEEIFASVSGVVHTQLCEPVVEKRQPATRTAAQFSLPWVLGTAALKRRLGINELAEEALGDRDLLDMAAKVRTVLDPTLPAEDAFAEVKIKTARGLFETLTSHPYGSVENPISIEDMETKFLDSASFARKTVPKEILARVISMVRELEGVKDITEIMKMIC